MKKQNRPAGFYLNRPYENAVRKSALVDKQIRVDKQNTQCSGKQKFPSYEEASKVAGYSIKRRPMNIYRCKFCAHWHLGSDAFKRTNKKHRMRDIEDEEDFYADC